MVAVLLLASCTTTVTEEEEGVVTTGKEVNIPIMLQEGNNLPKIQFEFKQSKELAACDEVWQKLSPRPKLFYGR